MVPTLALAFVVAVVGCRRDIAVAGVGDGGGSADGRDASGDVDGASRVADGGTTDAPTTTVDRGAADTGAVDAAGIDAAGPRDGASIGKDGGTSCPPYQLRCAGRCVTPKVDPAHCGRCGNRCATGTVCSAGACRSTCQPPLRACSQRCVATGSDSANCGACGVTCKAGQGCVDGNCGAVVPVKPAPAKCKGGGPAITVRAGAFKRCAGNVAQVAFRWALCACRDIGPLGGDLLTDGYDGDKGPYAPGGKGASVGVNGAFKTTHPTEVWGSLWVSAKGGMTSRSDIDIKRDLRVGGALALDKGTIDGDGYVAGNVSSTNRVSLKGTLFVPSTATVGGRFSAGKITRRAVSVPPPCDCSAPHLVPVKAIVAARAGANNDNVAIGLSANVFASAKSTRTRLDLPCGEYYLSKIVPGKRITIAANGRTALYIGGDVKVDDPLTFALSPTAELDVFIAGGLCVDADFHVGSPNFPSQLRMYVGGTTSCDTSTYSVFLHNATDIAGNVYAPNGKVFAKSKVRQYGATFAGSYTNTSTTTIHYDRAVTRAGKTCAPSGGGGGGRADGGVKDARAPDAGVRGCKTCRDCFNQACIGGRCTACRTNADCCAPLWCVAGMCVPPLR